MARITVRYLITKPGAAGTVRFFWQPSLALRAEGWRARRLPDGEAAAFAEAGRLNAALDAWREGLGPSPAGETSIRSGSVDALIADYKASRHFRDRRPSTRRGYDQCLAVISRWAGDTPVRAIDAPLVAELYEALRERTPAMANAVIRVLRLVLEFARRARGPGGRPYIEHNPARRPGLTAPPPSGRLWSAEAVRHFVATADVLGRHSIGTAVALNEWLGQREGDIIRLPRSVYVDGALRLTQAKTGAKVELPVGMVPHLSRRLEEEFGRQGNASITATTIIVSETTGQAYTSDNFRAVFARVRARAAETLPEVADLWFMHLRHTAVTRLFEAGCSLAMVAAVTGHSIKTCETIIDRYLIRTGELARAAFAKRLEKERE